MRAGLILGRKAIPGRACSRGKGSELLIIIITIVIITRAGAHSTYHVPVSAPSFPNGLYGNIMW